MQRGEALFVPRMGVDALVLDQKSNDRQMTLERGLVESGLALCVLHADERTALGGAEKLDDGEMAMRGREVERGDEGMLRQGSIGECKGRELWFGYAKDKIKVTSELRQGVESRGRWQAGLTDEAA